MRVHFDLFAYFENIHNRIHINLFAHLFVWLASCWAMWLMEAAHCALPFTISCTSLQLIFNSCGKQILTRAHFFIDFKILSVLFLHFFVWFLDNFFFVGCCCSLFFYRIFIFNYLYEMIYLRLIFIRHHVLLTFSCQADARFCWGGVGVGWGEQICICFVFYQHLRIIYISVLLS